MQAYCAATGVPSNECDGSDDEDLSQPAQKRMRVEKHAKLMRYILLHNGSGLRIREDIKRRKISASITTCDIDAVLAELQHQGCGRIINDAKQKQFFVKTRPSKMPKDFLTSLSIDVGLYKEHFKTRGPADVHDDEFLKETKKWTSATYLSQPK